MSTIDPVRMKRLLALLGKTRASEIVSLRAKTTVELVRVPKDHPFKTKTFHKTAKLTGILGTGVNYERAVNNRRLKEGKEATFEAEPLPWGEWIPGLEGLAIKHGDMVYLRVSPTSSSEEVITDEDGNIIDPKELEPFKPKKSPSRQGLENEFKVRTIKVINLLSLKACGEEIVF